jgi:hypothetical protein
MVEVPAGGEIGVQREPLDDRSVRPAEELTSSESDVGSGLPQQAGDRWSPPSVDELQVVRLHCPIGRDQHERLRPGLSDQHAVERVVMRRWQVCS